MRNIQLSQNTVIRRTEGINQNLEEISMANIDNAMQ